MSKNKIEVVVQGLVGSGKTTIIQLIKKALKAEGIDFTAFPSEEEELPDELLQLRLDAIRDNVKVELEERSESRFFTINKNELGSAPKRKTRTYGFSL